MPSTMVLLTYPTIIECDDGSYNGFLTVNEKDYEICFKRTEANKIIINYKISSKLLPIRKKIDDFTNNTTLDFLKKLEELLKTQLQTTEKNESIHRNYRAIINDYVEFCKFYINIQGSFITSDLNKIKLCYTDDNNRRFAVDLLICYSKSYFAYEMIQSSIPLSEIEASSSLVAIYNSFSNLIESPHMQTFFTLLDEIDANCWVLDPETPSYKENYRRIVLETNTSALLNIFEHNAKGLPEIKIFGSQQRIEHFTDKMEENICNWDADKNIIEQLLQLFDITEFPVKPTANFAEGCLLNDGECCICFTLRLEDVLPDVVCSNTSCNQIFHQKCLYQWLSAINAGSSVYELYGPCPNCEKPTFSNIQRIFRLPTNSLYLSGDEFAPIKPGGLFQLAYRTIIRIHFPRPCERKRIKRHGFEKRMSTPNGRKLLMNAILKGKHVICH